MRIIFCADPLNRRVPDSAYEAEVAAAEAAGFGYDLISYEALVDGGNPVAAVRSVAERGTPELAVYRGWMLKPVEYSRLYENLEPKGIRLINSPAAYLHCHYFPESYSIIEGSTPRSVWLSTDGGLAIDRIMDELRVFGERPVILKDFVKSRKHEWDTACYIRNASDRAAVEPIVRRFLELQGEDLAGGLVFREFVELESIGNHPQSRMPLAREFRLFFIDGRPLGPYDFGRWSSGETAGECRTGRVLSRPGRNNARLGFLIRTPAIRVGQAATVRCLN